MRLVRFVRKHWAVVLVVVIWFGLFVPTLYFSLEGDSTEPLLWVGWLQVTTAAIAFLAVVKALRVANETLEAQRHQIQVLSTPSELTLSFARGISTTVSGISLTVNHYFITVSASAGVGPIDEFTIVLQFEHPLSTTSILKFGSANPSPFRNPVVRGTESTLYNHKVAMRIVSGAKDVALGTLEFMPASSTIYAWNCQWGV